LPEDDFGNVAGKNLSGKKYRDRDEGERGECEQEPFGDESWNNPVHGEKSAPAFLP
jgi:hypothetical protein